MIWHDARTAGGFSGGPLVTREGALVGIHVGTTDDPAISIALRPDPAWLLERIEVDRRLEAARSRP
jgi:S1-C subfamily serine protease